MDVQLYTDMSFEKEAEESKSRPDSSTVFDKERHKSCERFKKDFEEFLHPIADDEAIVGYLKATLEIIKMDYKKLISEDPEAIGVALGLLDGLLQSSAFSYIVIDEDVFKTFKEILTVIQKTEAPAHILSWNGFKDAINENITRIKDEEEILWLQHRLEFNEIIRIIS
jgi:hypothetical protein